MTDKSVTRDSVIDSDFREKYESEFDEIYRQLRCAKNNLIIVKQIIEFPFEVLQPSIGFTFWNYVEHALFDSTVLALSIVISETKGYYSLERFYARVVDHYLRVDISDSIRKNLEARFAGYQQQTESIKDDIKRLRDKHIAHKDRDANTTVPRGLEYSRLSHAVDVAGQLFDALSFSKVILETWDYAPRPSAENWYIDVEELLGYVANTSLFIRRYSEDYMRDEQAESYAELSEEQRETVDSWRKRVKDIGICDNQ